MIRLRSSRIPTLITLATLSLGLAACGSSADPAEPADAQTRLRATVPQITQAAESAVVVVEEMPAMTWLEDSLDAANVSFASLPFELELPSLIGEDGDDFGSFLDSFKQSDDEEIEAIIALIFNEQNYEGDGYYRLSAEALCEEDFDTGAPDADCVNELNKAEIRVRALLAGDGLDISLAIGPNRAEPLVLELRSDRVSLVIDLAEGKQAIAELARLSGEEVELPEVMEGVIALSLVVHSEVDVSIEAAVRQAARLEAALPEGQLSFSSAAKDPMFAVRFNGADNEVTFSLDVGQTTLSAPWNLIETDSLVSGGVYAMDFGGMSATTTLRENDTSLTISNIGFGDGTTTLKLDDNVLFAMDLNADLNRRFSMTIAPSANGAASIALDPGFDLSLAYDLRPLADAGELVEDFLLNETYRIAFTGQNPTAEPFAPDTAGDGGIRITAGTLSISSSAEAAAITVNAGQCLVENPIPAVGAHPVLGFLEVSDCQ